MSKEKYVFFGNLQNVCSFLNIKKEGTRNCINCKTLKRAFGLPLYCEFWQIAAGIKENPGPLVTTVQKQKQTHFQCQRSCEVCHFDKRTSLHQTLSECIGNISKMFSRGQKEQMNIQIRTFLIMFGLQQLVWKTQYGRDMQWLRNSSCPFHIYGSMWKVHQPQIFKSHYEMASRQKVVT